MGKTEEMASEYMLRAAKKMAENEGREWGRIEKSEQQVWGRRAATALAVYSKIMEEWASAKPTVN